MATPNISVNYDDNRFTEVEADKKAALSEVDTTYGNMINNTDAFYQKQMDAANDYAEKQAQLQQERTDFAIEQINQQKEQTTKDYQKEQSGAYVDWQKQSNEFGVQAEQMAAQGMNNTGFSESSQVSMWNTYQNRVATARESYNRAILNYDNAIKDAQLQNNAALAEIAYNALQTQLELSLEGFQYKNTLVLAQSDKKMEVDNNYYSRYQDVLNQINHENAMAEEIRQYNASLAQQQAEFAFQKQKYADQKAQEAAEKAAIEAANSTGNKNKVNYHDDGDNGSYYDTIIAKRNENKAKQDVPFDYDLMNQMGLSTWSEEQLAEAVAQGYLRYYEEGGLGKFQWTGKKADRLTGNIVRSTMNGYNGFGVRLYNAAKGTLF